MPIFLQHTGTSCRWAIWKMDESVEQLLSLLPCPDVWHRAVESFHSEHRKREWLSVRVLLYMMRGRVADLAYHPGGKPFLTDGSASVSISHTGGYAAVILGEPGHETGIDIEQAGERVRRVTSRFMRPDELPSFYRGTDMWSLLLHWSAKETVFKCLNMSAVDFQEHLSVSPFQVSERGTFTVHESRTRDCHRFTVHYRVCPDFVLTWVE